ncbi:MAG: phospho-N-acetylmuramoyl-pentapeptide-transferase [Cytophagales bacterium]|nr:phospho-N-acetylmuramoyl-pentapeptide-transferase [Cytophagales bacterium]
MFYYLFDFLETKYDLVGAGVFQYISFRSIMASILSLLVAMYFGKRLIALLQRKQVDENIRELGLAGQTDKKGTPTMGGLIILIGILIPTLLFAKIDNIYIILMLISTVWLGFIGFIDDYIKVFKKNKEGLAGRFKIFGQVGLGIIVGLTLYFHEDVVIRQYSAESIELQLAQYEKQYLASRQSTLAGGPDTDYVDTRSTKTTIPFLKNNEFDYGSLVSFINKDLTWLVYVLIVIFIITAVSNGANLTDGLDGLLAGSSAIIGLTLAVLAYISGNIIFSDYLNIMYIPNSGELVIFCGAFVGACVGFLWYNSYPAKVFMGDTGSLTLGGIIAVLALTIRKELLIPLLCGIFLIEIVSVIIQVLYFKYTKKRFGQGKRIFKMAPLHHHYQKLNFHESKIVMRFLIICMMLAVLTLVTLKLR